MARKNDSSAAVDKVARAADTGSRRDIPLFSRIGFPALIGLICILGIANVTFFKLTRAEEQKPVQNRDHWHAVYGIWDCTQNGGDGAWLAPFQSANDPLGIHSHQDGIMHIHPFFDAADGPDAQLHVFFDAMGVELTDDSITLDTGRTLTSGESCGGEAAQLHIRKWQFDFTADTADPEIFTTELGEIPYLNDREVYSIVFAPLEAEIPLPPEERFGQLNAVAGSLQSTGPVVLDDANVTFDVDGAPATDDAPADAGVEVEDVEADGDN